MARLKFAPNRKAKKKNQKKKQFVRILIKQKSDFFLRRNSIEKHLLRSKLCSVLVHDNTVIQIQCRIHSLQIFHILHNTLIILRHPSRCLFWFLGTKKNCRSNTQSPRSSPLSSTAFVVVVQFGRLRTREIEGGKKNIPKKNINKNRNVQWKRCIFMFVCVRACVSYILDQETFAFNDIPSLVFTSHDRAIQWTEHPLFVSAARDTYQNWFSFSQFFVHINSTTHLT